MIETTLHGADALIRDISESIPAILHPNCAEGLTRLRLTARGSYIAIGYYYANTGCNAVLVCMDGELNKMDRFNMLETVTGTISDGDGANTDCCGFFTVHLSDTPGYKSYSHYYISL